MRSIRKLQQPPAMTREAAVKPAHLTHQRQSWRGLVPAVSRLVSTLFRACNTLSKLRFGFVAEESVERESRRRRHECPRHVIQPKHRKICGLRPASAFKETKATGGAPNRL